MSLPSPPAFSQEWQSQQGLGWSSTCLGEGLVSCWLRVNSEGELQVTAASICEWGTLSILLSSARSLPSFISWYRYHTCRKGSRRSPWFSSLHDAWIDSCFTPSSPLPGQEPYQHSNSSLILLPLLSRYFMSFLAFSRLLTNIKS